MEVRPIDANALIASIENAKRILKDRGKNIDVKIAELMIDIISSETCAPTLDYAPIRHGEWEECDWVSYDGHGECVRYPKKALCCTNCRNAFRKELLWKRNFCPNCGAKMDGGKKADG